MIEEEDEKGSQRRKDKRIKKTPSMYSYIGGGGSDLKLENLQAKSALTQLTVLQTKHTVYCFIL